MTALYHIIKTDELESLLAAKDYKPNSLLSDGFIHLAYEKQLKHVIRRFFEGVEDVLLVKLNPDKLEAEVKNEPAFDTKSDGNSFPHLYGPLNTNAISKVYSLVIDAEGNFKKLEIK